MRYVAFLLFIVAALAHAEDGAQILTVRELVGGFAVQVRSDAGTSLTLSAGDGVTTATGTAVRCDGPTWCKVGGLANTVQTYTLDLEAGDAAVRIGERETLDPLALLMEGRTAEEQQLFRTHLANAMSSLTPAQRTAMVGMIVTAIKTWSNALIARDVTTEGDDYDRRKAERLAEIQLQEVE